MNKLEISRNKVITTIVSLLIPSLVSCGGGSSGGSSKPPPETPSSRVSSVASSTASTAISSSNASTNSSSATTQSSSAALTAPQNVAAIPGNAQVTVSWNEVAGATSYRIYIASESNILIGSIANLNDGARVDNATSPYLISGLRNGQTYYLVVTALGNGGHESVPSREVSATPGSVDIARQPTAREVLVMELVNRARANPGDEARRLGIGLNDGISGTQITDTPKQPLAHNLLLIASSRLHSQWMLDEDIFSHTGVNNSTPHDRMAAAGYQFSGNWSSGENIAWGGTTGSTINLTSYAVSQHEGLFKSPGHRVNILNNDFRELGVGQSQGSFTHEGRNYLSSMLTQNFARSGSNYFLTGVVYNDKNNNEFYDVGEGLSGITITTNQKTYQVFEAGAYSIPLPNGLYELSITGDALDDPVYYSVQISNRNRKLDVIKSNNNIRVSSP